MQKRTLIASLLAAASLTAQGDHGQKLNLPIIQTKYTADPAPYVHGDTVYLYTTHDEDNAEGFLMKDWLLYTSTDMVNWQDHGAVASLKDFKWYKGQNGAWAEQVIERNGGRLKEMEGAAVAFVCSLYHVPVVLVKAVTNLRDSGNDDDMESFHQNLIKASKALLAINKKIISKI